MKTQKMIKVLREKLKDEGYKISWVANIAMAQLDAEVHYREKNNKVGKYLNKSDRHAITNKGAENFLDLLTAE